MIYIKILTLYIVLCLGNSFAGIEQSPPSFISGTKKAVWIDFISADYNLIFDFKSKKTKSISTIHFELLEKGFPIFDLVNTPSKILIDGMSYEQLEISTPGKESKVRIVNVELSPGSYTLKIESDVTNGIIFNGDSVSAGFFMSDMKDRKFLENYIPSNYEYDQYKMNLSLKIIGTKKLHKLFTNGSLIEESFNSFKYTYPEYFTSSSLYLHLVPESKFKVINFIYESKLSNGRDFPVTIYSKKKKLNKRIKKKVSKVLKELERDYGPWPHPQLIFYGDGKWRGGMEYAGAATAGWFAIGHELQHGYFARAVMPANGNSGWIDEAVASWRDFYTLHNFFHFGKEKMKYTSMNLGNHSIYTRKSDHRSYKSGRSFMFYIDSLLKDIPGKSLKKFLRIYFDNRKYSTIKTEDFRLDLENYYGKNLESLFDRYINGKSSKTKSIDREHDDYHPALSNKQLKELI